VLRLMRDLAGIIAVGIAVGWSGDRIPVGGKRGFSHSSRPVLGPTQPPIQRLPGLSRG
jgi:hypothetical protein